MRHRGVDVLCASFPENFGHAAQGSSGDSEVVDQQHILFGDTADDFEDLSLFAVIRACLVADDYGNSEQNLRRQQPIWQNQHRDCTQQGL